MKELTGATILALVVVGCSTSSAVPKHKFDYENVALLKKCFVEVVR